MTPSSPVTCPTCHLLIEESDHFCRHCGRSLKPGESFLYSHTGIVLMSLILGPFALPFVWLSKRIGLAAKMAYSAALGLIGIYFAITCYRIYQLTLQTAQSFMGSGF